MFRGLGQTRLGRGERGGEGQRRGVRRGVVLAEQSNISVQVVPVYVKLCLTVG